MDVPLVPLTTAPREKLRLAFTVNDEPRDVVVESYLSLIHI